MDPTGGWDKVREAVGRVRGTERVWGDSETEKGDGPFRRDLVWRAQGISVLSEVVISQGDGANER